ncbi:putative reverse transcriptase domain-containing protein, partial [Tanacetum coccineum]
TDKAKIPRKRLKPGKLEHGNGRASKNPGGSYQNQTLVRPWSILSQPKKERVKPRRVRAMAMTIQFGIKGLILAAQGEAFKDENAIAEGLNGTDQQMEKREDGSLYYMDRIWVPLVDGVKSKIMDEAHKTRYSVHPGADKMYYDLRDMYWWPGMKKEIVIFVSKCLTCAKVKEKHQRPSGLLQQSEIPEWK